MPHLFHVFPLPICFFPVAGTVEHLWNLPRQSFIPQVHSHKVSFATWSNLGSITPMHQREIVEKVQIALLGGDGNLVFFC